ncbi:oligosaccharide flippase family protein [Clostridium sp. Marseille-QA1073]
MSKNNLFKKFLSFSIGSWIAIIIGFIQAPLVTRLIGPYDLGGFEIFGMYTSVAMACIICGTDSAFIRFFYDEDEKYRKNLLFNCLKIPFIANLFSILFLIIFGNAISSYLFEGNKRIIILLGLHTTFLILNRFSTTIIRMKQKGKTFSALVVAQKISNLIFIIVYSISYGSDFMTLAYASFFSNLVVTLIAILVELDIWNPFTLKKYQNGKTQKEILSYGFPLAFTTLISILFQLTDKGTIEYFCGRTEVGIYGSAGFVIVLIDIVKNSFSTFWTPVAFEKYKKEPENVRFFEDVNQIITIVMFLGGILLILFRDVIIFILGPEYRTARFIIPFLTLMPIMYTISETTVIGINFLKNPKAHIHISVVCCILNLIGNIILVPIYGGKGAAISTGLSNIIFFIMRTFISLKHFKVNYHLKKFSIMTLAFSSYILYATFNKANMTYIFIGIGELLLLYFLYKDYINRGVLAFNKSYIKK